MISKTLKNLKSKTVDLKERLAAIASEKSVILRKVL